MHVYLVVCILPNTLVEMSRCFCILGLWRFYVLSSLYDMDNEDAVDRSRIRRTKRSIRNQPSRRHRTSKVEVHYIGLD